MTARPSLTDAAALVSEAAVARLRARPGFRAAVERYTCEALTHSRGLDPTGRWMLADLGRSAIYMTIMIMDALPGGASAATTATLCTDTGAASRGRVAQFIRFAQDAGELGVPPGPDHWTRRRLILRPAFVERLRERAMVEARAIARFAPEVSSLADKLRDDATYRRFLQMSAMLIPPEPYAETPGAMMFFLHRECGMRILQHLMLDQSQDRTRMLEAAPLSRNQLSQTYGVSRAHINRLLADAAAQGLVHLPTPRRVEFAAALSEDYERTVATLFQRYHAAYLATLATEPPAGG